MNKLLLCAIALFSLPFAAGENSVQMFHCESEGCAADVTRVYCNDEELLNNRAIADCSGPPPPGAVCQHGGRAFVSISGNARCEFEGNGEYIKTKKCTDLSNVCLSFRATTTSPVTSRGVQNTAFDLTGLIIGVVYVLKLVLDQKMAALRITSP